MITVLVGPPCAGKTTRMVDAAKPGDVTIDLDAIAETLGGLTPAARAARQAAIDEVLASRVDAWIIHTNPNPDQIAAYQNAGAIFELVDPGIETALERAKIRPDRTADVIRKWYTSPPELPRPGGGEKPKQTPEVRTMPEPEAPKPDEEAPEATELTATDKASFQAELTKKNNEAKGLRDRLKAAEDALQKITDKDKSDSDKAVERATALEAEKADLLRENVALSAGLTTAQAKRLVGATREELEADAAELVETLGIKPQAPIVGKPTEQLPRGGGDPDQQVEETDPAKLAGAVPRGW